MPPFSALITAGARAVRRAITAAPGATVATRSPWRHAAPLAAAFATLAIGFGSGCAVAAGGSQGITREQGDAILNELREIRRELAAQRARPAQAAAEQPATVKLADAGHNVLGAAGAPVTVVEFTDFQCPFCKRFHDRTWAEIRKNYVDTGKVRFVARDLPLPFHEQAMPAAIAARCAAAQGKYWAARDALFGTQETLVAETVRKLLVAAGIDGTAYDACIKQPEWSKSIQADMAEADRIGITGTPGFVIARRDGGQLEGTLLLGAQPYAAFAARIDALLAEPAKP